jgi:DNA-binding IclR family transcriptional regulator
LAYKLTRLLEILGDGNWHETDQLCHLMDLSDSEVQRIMDFLEKYNFAEVDEAKKRVRIKKDFKRILTQTA